jgi:hypothetical protein
VQATEIALRKAASLYRAGKFAEAGKLIQEAQDELDALPPDDADELSALTAEPRKRLARARELLKEKGIELRAPRGTPLAEAVRFTTQIAPLLVAKCGSCHIQRSRGELSMATFAALEKGSAAGAVIMPGDAEGSRLVELIEAGDMPRGGGKVAADELALLVKWINEGAEFDGPDPTAPLTSLRPRGPDESLPKVPLLAAGESDEVQFARDVGGILLEHCLECHGTENPRNQFSMSTFRRLLAGGDSGPVVVPGKPEESLLVKKLRGTAAGPRMPQGRPPLPDATIAIIAKWIALGARFDGADPAGALEETVARTIAERSTHDELAQRRAELAEKNWRLILPDAKGDREETAQVLVYGNVGRELLADVARVADQQAAALARLFKRPAEAPLVKGRLTLYVFDKRYDYSEVGTMLEQREIPAAWRGHWRHTGVDAYGCILLEADAVPPGLVTQQLAGAYIASLGDVPRWFAEGTARAVAARVDPKDQRIKAWDDAVAATLQAVEKPELFLTAQLPPEESDVLSYSFVRFLIAGSNRHAALLAELAEGAEFDEAFSRRYRAAPRDLVDDWKARTLGRRRR